MLMIKRVNHSYDYRPNWTPLSPITIINNNFYYSKPFSLSLQPLTAFAELGYGRRDFAKKEGRHKEKGKVERVAEGELGG